MRATRRAKTAPRPWLALLGLLVLAVAGAAAFLLFDGSARPTSDRAPVVSPEPEDERPPMQVEPAPEPPSRATPLATPLDAPGERALPAMEVADGTPRSSIVGRAVDPAGQGVAGVTLWVELGNALGGLSFSPWRKDVPGVRATSLADGSFVLDGVPVGRDYVVVGEHPDFARSETPHLPVKAREPTDGVVLRMEQGATVRGRVETDGGSPLVQARVSIFDATINLATRADEQRPWKVVFSDGGGAFEIAHVSVPSFRVEVEAVGYESQARLVSFALADRPQDVDLTFTLGAGYDLPGRVVDDRGAAVAGARIEVTSLTKDYQGHVVAHSQSDGRFLLEGMGEHSYQLRASCKGYSLAQLPKVHVGDGEVLVEMSRRLAVEGWVATRSGTPVPEFTLTLMRTAQGREPLLLDDTRPFQSKDGYFLFDDLDPGAYAFTARAEGLAGARSDVFELVRDDSPPPQVRIRMGRGGTLKGTVLGPDGAPVAAADVRLNPNNHIESPVLGLFQQMSPVREEQITTRTDDAGRYALTHVTPGTYQIAVRHGGAAPVARNDVVVVDDEEGGNPPLDLRLPPGAVIAGVAFDSNRKALPFTEVQLSTAEGYVENLTTDKDGRFEFKNLGEGSYDLMVKPSIVDEVEVNPLVKLVYATRSKREIYVGSGQALTDVELYLPSRDQVQAQR